MQSDDLEHSVSVQPMNRLSRALGLALLAIAASVFASVPALADEPAPNEHTALHEIDFMQHAMDLHLVSQRMSEACAERATDPEVLELCSMMVDAHRDDRTQLSNWLQSWYGDEHEATIPEPQQARLEQLQSLSGAEFEQRFLMDMTTKHVVAIKEGAMCEAQFYHDELISYCQASIAASADEIQIMRNELCETHGICDLKLTPDPVASVPQEPFDMNMDDADQDDDDGNNGG